MNLIMTEQQWPLLQSLHCNIIQMDTIEAGRLSDSSPSSVSILFNRNRNCNRNTKACFKKNSSLHISQKNFSTTFFRILPEKCLHFFKSSPFFTIFTPYFL